MTQTLTTIPIPHSQLYITLFEIQNRLRETKSGLQTKTVGNTTNIRREPQHKRKNVIYVQFILFLDSVQDGQRDGIWCWYSLR